MTSEGSSNEWSVRRFKSIPDQSKINSRWISYRKVRIAQTVLFVAGNIWKRVEIRRDINFRKGWTLYDTDDTFGHASEQLVTITEGTKPPEIDNTFVNHEPPKPRYAFPTCWKWSFNARGSLHFTLSNNMNSPIFAPSKTYYLAFALLNWFSTNYIRIKTKSTTGSSCMGEYRWRSYWRTGSSWISDTVCQVLHQDSLEHSGKVIPLKVPPSNTTQSDYYIDKIAVFERGNRLKTAKKLWGIDALSSQLNYWYYGEAFRPRSLPQHWHRNYSTHVLRTMASGSTII